MNEAIGSGPASKAVAPSTWQSLPDNAKGVTVAYPAAAAPEALPSVTIDLKVVPGAIPAPAKQDTPYPVTLRTVGSGDSFRVEAVTSDGKTQPAKPHGIDLVLDAIRNELARTDLSPAQREQVVSLYTSTNVARQHAKFQDDPLGDKDATAMSRYQDARQNPANQGKALNLLQFFEK